MSELQSSSSELLSCSDSCELKALQEWVERLSSVELPAIGSTVEKIQKLTGDDGHAIQRLADVILQDAAMTAHILRMTSSAYHVPANRSNSITRAIVTLGLKEVRSICLSIAVMGGLVTREESEPMATELARAFHGAVQAEQLACAVGDRSPQEIFIATLLFDLGRMIFWCFGGTDATRLKAAIKKEPDRDPLEIEREILGFELSDLTVKLAERWGLGELLLKSLRRGGSDSTRVAGVRLGNQFAKAVEKGWDAPETVALVEQMSTITGLSPNALNPILHLGAEKAKAIALEFQASICVDSIPMPPSQNMDTQSGDANFIPPEESQEYQLTSLRNISLKLDSCKEVQEILDLVLDGIHRGVGMDRAIFAILSPNRKYLIGKSGLGYRHAELTANLKLPVDQTVPNIFQWIIEGQNAVWVEDPSEADYSRLISESVRGMIGANPSFIAPVMVTGKPIGVIYADRSPSNRPLHVEAFQAFKQFVLTANISLEHFKAMQAKRT